MLRVNKPQNARAKRALKAREPKLVEGPKTALFVKGTNTSNLVNIALSELLLLKKPNGILFSKKNAVYPFEDPTSLEFFSNKNDASIVIIGMHQKKRPNNLTFVRMFDHQVLDMIEVGIEKGLSMKELNTPKASVGQNPLFHFSGSLFDSDPRYKMFKSMILDTFKGEPVQELSLAKGIEYVISVSHLPLEDEESSTTTANGQESDLSSKIRQNVTKSIIQDGTTASTLSSSTSTPLIYFRVYTTKFMKSGQREPRIELEPMGPSFDFRIRRVQEPKEEVWKQANRAPVQAGKGGDSKSRKNIDINEMGDKVGQVHLGRQDLSQLQTRKMKGLKRKAPEELESSGDEEEEEDDDDDDDDDSEGTDVEGFNEDEEISVDEDEE